MLFACSWWLVRQNSAPFSTFHANKTREGGLVRDDLSSAYEKGQELWVIWLDRIFGDFEVGVPRQMRYVAIIGRCEMLLIQDFYHNVSWIHPQSLRHPSSVQTNQNVTCKNGWGLLLDRCPYCEAKEVKGQRLTQIILVLFHENLGKPRNHTKHPQSSGAKYPTAGFS